jgi:hypothetical protein
MCRSAAGNQELKFAPIFCGGGTISTSDFGVFQLWLLAP